MREKEIIWGLVRRKVKVREKEGNYKDNAKKNADEVGSSPVPMFIKMNEAMGAHRKRKRRENTSTRQPSYQDITLQIPFVNQTRPLCLIQLVRKRVEGRGAGTSQSHASTLHTL